jgi:hypothetical protein
MPVARYFMYVGELALQFISDAFLPKLAVADRTDTATELPAIRIHSDRKWPERVASQDRHRCRTNHRCEVYGEGKATAVPRVEDVPS